MIPFGQSAGGPFYNALFQQRCTAAELGSAAGVITGLAFADCGSTGAAHYDVLEIVLDHIPSAQPLSTTFANNLTPNAVTVLSAANYTWNIIANTWNEVGLQVPFVFNGTDDLVIQITSVNGTSPGGMYQSSHQRIYWIGTVGPPPASGTSGNTAGKIEVSMMTAHASSHGAGCVGSNGTPLLGFVGLPQIGQSLSLTLSNGVQNGVSLSLSGTTNAFPFPIELSGLGMPACYAYTDLLVTLAVGNDALGASSITLNIPPSTPPGFLFYTQFACLDPTANQFGLTTSNYGRVFVGN